jgi:hypothetical protein
MPSPSTADYDTASWLEVPVVLLQQQDNGEHESGLGREAGTGNEHRGRRFSYIGPGSAAGAVVTVSEMRRDVPGADALAQLVHASSDSADIPAVVTESVTSLGELMVTSTAARMVESEAGDLAQATVHRFTRVSAATSVYAEYVGDDDKLIPRIEALVAQLGRTEPVGVGWTPQTEEWSATLARAGVGALAAADTEADSAAGTDRAVAPAAASAAPPLVFARTDAELAASVLWSSSEGRANGELNRIGTRDDLERSALRNDIIVGAVTKPLNRGALWISAALVLTLVVGFALVQASNDYAMTMALVGSVLVAVGAAGLLAAELTPAAIAGTRTHVYGWKLYLALAALVGWATISASPIGADDSTGWQGPTVPTVVILVGSIAILLAAFAVAYRNRAAVKAAVEALHADDVQVKAFAARQAALDAGLLADLERFLASDAAAGVDRRAAVAMLSELVLSGRLPIWRAEGILATITR